MNDLHFPELTAASLAKFMISSLGFEHSSGCEKFESENFKKVKSLRSYFIFVAYLPREVDGRIISEIYFKIKIEYEDLDRVALNRVKCLRFPYNISEQHDDFITKKFCYIYIKRS